MRFAIETWAPDYGSPLDGEALGESGAPVATDVERPAAGWAPIAPSVAPAGSVLFVDGVERIDAWVWVGGDGGDDDDGVAHQGVCASWGAGAVRCGAGRAAVVAAEIRRGVLCPGVAVEAIATRHGIYAAHDVPAADGVDAIGQALSRARGGLEGRVAAEAGAAGDDLVVVDGPLGERRRVEGAVGYVKTHRVAYLPPELQRVVGTLGAGERTPLFTVGEDRFRWSWYLRLPGPGTHAWWGIVRCEAAGDLGPTEAAARAGLVAATLPRFASQPHHDPRAPQNLHPIAGLERELKRRLGDPLVLDRGLRAASRLSR